jgi:hypothetical protein
VNFIAIGWWTDSQDKERSCRHGNGLCSKRAQKPGVHLSSKKPLRNSSKLSSSLLLLFMLAFICCTEATGRRYSFAALRQLAAAMGTVLEWEWWCSSHPRANLGCGGSFAVSSLAMCSAADRRNLLSGRTHQFGFRCASFTSGACSPPSDVRGPTTGGPAILGPATGCYTNCQSDCQISTNLPNLCCRMVRVSADLGGPFLPPGCHSCVEGQYQQSEGNEPEVAGGQGPRALQMSQIAHSSSGRMAA